MAIPKNINNEHVIEAIHKIDSEGVPERRDSTRFKLSFEGKFYPPKYVITIANIFANGEEYSSSLFSGGDETNRFLSRLGFTIIESESNSIDNQNWNVLISVPDLEPVKRSREYQLYDNFIRNKIVYEYLFHSRTHRWLDEYVIGLNSDESGYQSMGILHFIGLKANHKGFFKDTSMSEAIALLEQQDSDFSLVIQCLQRYEQSGNDDLNKQAEPVAETANKLEQLAVAKTEKIIITETEKEQVIMSRIGQSTFKKALLAIEKKCRLCGLSDERFLVASHIKPWSQSNNQERLDVNNGLLLCPNHDTLFDKGYISFQEDGMILISASLDEATKVFLYINETMRLERNEVQKNYIKWHKENVFKE
ncbi:MULTISPECIES: HNH endonuclease [unclassified Bacillus (in: firmicutes)]|uniref:HNH endonuclease n=1 Tax=unclassified Bacillus (in: firmicutes) TaxID=185979 RepID=UPI002035ABC3|nr:MULTISPECIES: HNH endonuclease [unclassified Bacillus (in: firmicutes)]